MKKYILILLAFCVLFCFAGCSNNGVNSKNSDNAAQSETTVTVSGIFDNITHNSEFED